MTDGNYTCAPGYSVYFQIQALRIRSITTTMGLINTKTAILLKSLVSEKISDYYL